MRKKAGPVIAALLLIIVIVLIFVVGRKIEQYIPSEETEDLNTYYSIGSPDDVAIILNQELTEQKAKSYEGAVYITYEMLHELNSRFYWDSNEQLLRYTTADASVTAYAGQTDYYIGNDVTKGSTQIVRIEGDTVYVALDFVKN